MPAREVGLLLEFFPAEFLGLALPAREVGLLLEFFPAAFLGLTLPAREFDLLLEFFPAEFLGLALCTREVGLLLEFFPAEFLGFAFFACECGLLLELLLTLLLGFPHVFFLGANPLKLPLHEFRIRHRRRHRALFGRGWGRPPGGEVRNARRKQQYACQKRMHEQGQQPVTASPEPLPPGPDFLHGRTVGGGGSVSSPTLATPAPCRMAMTRTIPP